LEKINQFICENIFYYQLALFALSFLIARLPYVGKYLRVVNTLMHESGHSLMTLLTDGKVLKVELFSDTSGSTLTKSKSKFSQFLIAIAGYPFSSFMALCFAYLIFNNYFKAVLLAVAIIAFINLIFFVRNTHGVFWIITFVTLTLLSLRFGNNIVQYSFALIIAAICLLESLWSTIVIVKLSFSKSKNAGDADNLKKLTHIPAFLWALLFFSFAAFVSYKATILLLNFNADSLQKILML